MKIITRFAPSPTGNLHIGSIRTALFSWLYAKQHNGKFILRIENSDFNRSKDCYIKHIIKYLKWLNITWDNYIILQSKRFNRYKEILNYLLLKKLAYKCYCSKERLIKLKNIQIINKQKPKYDGYCLNKINIKYNINKKYVIRFNNPKIGITSFNDIIRGNIQINNIELDDLIISRSDGTFTYNFCCVIDDYDMNITHIIRGEEHINNTHKQINLLKSIDNNAKIPYFAHLPLILDINKKKLSKRKNNFTDISYYKNNGYLYFSIINYILRLGWAYKNKEIFSINEILSLFSLDKVHKSPSIFNLVKLKWYNKYYINNLSNKQLLNLFINFLKKYNLKYFNNINLEKILLILKPRCYTFLEMYNNYKYLFNNLILTNNLFKNILLIIDDINYINIIYLGLKNIVLFNSKNILFLIKKINIKLNLIYNDINIFTFLQLIITGKHNTPAISIIMEILGKDIIIYRINNFIKLIF